MAFTSKLSQICIFLTTLYSIAHSQAPPMTDPGLFANLLSSAGPTQPGTGVNDLTSMLGAAPPAAPASTGFAPTSMGLPPSPSFPTFGAGGSSPYIPPQAASPQPNNNNNNPLGQLMPYFMYRSGSDLMQMLAMFSFMRGGQSSGAGGMGGMFQSPFFMMNLLNNM